MPRKKLLLSWSSGKDSAWTLHLLRQQNEHEIVGLLTTVNQTFNRVAMHGTRVELLRAQAESAGLPLIELPLPWPCSNETYESVMQSACSDAIARGVEVIAFGDLYLQDIRAYREKQLQSTGLTPIFPLWEIPTDKLAQQMISGGLRARLTCIDPKSLPHSFAGREFDAALLSNLPSGTDPCGENGEFHTCVYAGPMFSQPIEITTGDTVERDGFVYADMTMFKLAQAPSPACP
jgi:uncharacterized protein (TIGR00290 family)